MLYHAALIIEYIFLTGYFAFLWWTADANAAQTSRDISDLVFIQFFAHLTTAVLAMQVGTRLRGIWLWLLVLIYAGVGGWFISDIIGGWLATVIWVVSVGIGLLTDRENALGYAILEGGWLMFAGFLAALVGSMSGVPEESLLVDHIGTTAGWGILYYAGLLMSEWLLNLPQQPTEYEESTE